jgi:hypothetical protein
MNIRDFDLIVINGDSFSFGDGQFIENQYKKGRIIKDFSELTPKEIEFASLFDYVNNWGSHMGEKSNLPVLNISQAGSCNEFILRRYMDLFEDANFEYHVNLFPKERYFIQQEKIKVAGVDEFSAYKNPLIITQLSYSHRYPIRYNDKYYVIHPNMMFDENSIKYRELQDDSHLINTIKDHFFLTTSYKSYYEGFIKDLLSIKSYVESKNFTHLIYIFFSESDILKVAKDANVPPRQFVEHMNTFMNVFFLHKDALKFENIRDVTNGEINSYHFSKESHFAVANSILENIEKNANPFIINNPFLFVEL